MNFDWVYEYGGWLSYVILFCVPVLLIWGWLRWWKRDKKHSLIPIMSLIGFFLATASSLLAISTVVYATVIGGFPFYDPTLIRIYKYGALLSLSGIVFSFAGLWRPNALRWHSLLCAVVTLAFWFLLAALE